MKKFITIFVALFSAIYSESQSITISDSSAYSGSLKSVLDIMSSATGNKGFLLPGINNTRLNSLSLNSTESGLIFYNTNHINTAADNLGYGGLMYWAGFGFVKISGNLGKVTNGAGEWNHNLAFGHKAGNSISNSTRNILIGAFSGYSMTDANSIDNIFIGHKSGYSGSGELKRNIGIGNEAGKSLISGNGNTFLGMKSGEFSDDDSCQTFIGMSSGRYQTGSTGSVFIGSEAGLGSNGASTNASYNVAVGIQSGMSLTTGDDNVFVGAYSGKSVTSGEGNVAIGRDAGNSLTVGNFNVLLGQNAGRLITGDASSSSENVIIGHSAGESATNANVYIGYETGKSITGSGNVFIGNQVGASNIAATTSNTLAIDNSDISTPLISGDFSSNTLTVNGTKVEFLQPLASSATPDVSASNVWTYAGPGSITITNFLNAKPNAFYTIKGYDNTNTLTINNGGNFKLAPDYPVVTLKANDFIMFYCVDATHFVEITRNCQQNTAYAEIYVANGTYEQSPPNGLAWGSDQAILKCFTHNGLSMNCTPAAQLDPASAIDDKITIVKPGKYLVSGTFTFLSTADNMFWRFRLYKNNDLMENFVTSKNTSNIVELETASFRGIISCNSNDNLYVKTSHDLGGNVDLTVVYANLNVLYIGE